LLKQYAKCKYFFFLNQQKEDEGSGEIAGKKKLSVRYNGFHSVKICEEDISLFEAQQ